MANSHPHRTPQPAPRRPRIAAALPLAAVAALALMMAGCHATSAGLDGMDWLSDGLADIDDAVQRDLDRR
ncbi:MAG: hypothetical protein AAF078_09125 [Planctomycetota bacterium]